MAKRRLRLDSARRNGLETSFHEVLTLVGDGLYWVLKFVGAEFRSSEWETFLLTEPRPVMLWQNGGHGWIHPVEKVQKHPSTKLLTAVVMHQQVVRWFWWNSENWNSEMFLLLKLQLGMLW